MRRSVLPALTALAVGLTVAACGSGEDADAAAPTPTPPAESAPAASTGEVAPLLSDLEAQRNERGNVPRQLGELAGVRPAGVPGAVPQAAIRVEQIVVDPECESEEVPVNGRFVALEMSVLTTPELDPRVPMSFTEERFSVLAPDGTAIATEDSNARDCLDPEVFVPNMRFPAGVEYRGWLVLDIPVGSGIVVYSPPGATGGWEWRF